MILNRFKFVYRKIQKSKDGRALVTNLGYLSILQIVSYVFPLLTLPYLARIIGAEGFGKIAFASSIMIWFVTIADWGFNYTATRDVARCRDDREQVSLIFSTVLWARCLLMLISLVILLLLIALVPAFREASDVILVTFLMIPGYIMFPDWFFQAVERMKYTTILNLLSKTVFTIAIFLFIKDKEDYILQPFFTSLGFVVSGIIAMYLIVYRWGISLHKPNLQEIIQVIKNSTDVFLSNFFPNLYSNLSTVLLGIFYGNIANGIFDAGIKIVRIIQNFINIIARVFFPYFSRDISKHHIYAKICIFLALITSLTLFFLAPYIINIFFTSEFEDATIVLQICSFLVLILMVDTVYGTNFMIIQGYEKQRRKIVVMISAIGAFVSILLVYKYSFIGKSVSLIFVNGILAIVTMAFCKIKTKKIQNEKIS